MNVFIQVVDSDTGEIISRNSRNLVFDPTNKNDVGFKLCRDWIASTLRGIRDPRYKHDKLQVSFTFCGSTADSNLFASCDSRMKQFESVEVY